MASLRKTSVTLKTIAKEANCSIAVASTVLNGSHGNTKVSEEMRNHLLGIAKRLEYHPNSASRNLKRGNSRTLGVYVQPKTWRDLSNSYEIAIFKGVEQAARKFGYDLLVLNLCSSNFPEICGRRIREKQIDGVVLIHCDSGSTWIDELLDISPNVVAIDYSEHHPRLCRVEFDNYAAVRLATMRLLELGHRRIGFVASCIENPENDAQIRKNAYLSLRQELGIDLDDSLVFDIERCPRRISLEEHYCQAEGVEAFHYFHSTPKPPTAIIAYNILAGVSFIFEAQRQGVRIPDELSVICTDNSVSTDFLSPAPAVVDHRLSEMGNAGIELLLELIEGRASIPCVRKIQPLLIPGETLKNCALNT